ncbi:galactokinase [Candidatus Poribacteria bacterium]|nr:galactokinase [Candidatus Poribacteria bacterium]
MKRNVLRTETGQVVYPPRILNANQKFKEIFGDPSAFVVSAPGRVNLIGEHTDYNDGYVFPVAIDKYLNIAARKRSDGRVRLYALDVNDSYEFRLDTLPSIQQDAPAWSHYLIGVAALLQTLEKKVSGIDAIITGDVPIGAGLSSSAALSVSAALTFLAASSTSGTSERVPQSEVDNKELAALCQRVEHEFAGVNCGIMDQTISLLGQENQALFLDCRSLEHEHVPLNLGTTHSIAICNTRVKRELAASEYNKRRAECERGVAILKQWLPGISSLRDITLTDFKKHEEELPVLTQKRCRYVIEENTRVLDAVAVLKARHLQTVEETDESLTQFGRLMNASHNGLRDDYEVSCSELDLLTDIARRITGVIGSRMTGAGFGGCTVNIVHRDVLETFQTLVTAEYYKQTGIEPEIYLCNVSDGAQVFFL